MRTRIANLWDKVHSSFWFVPALMVAVAGTLAHLAVAADRQIHVRGDAGWLWSGEPQGAREMLTTIAASMITVAGVSFSITVVALTLAAGQFGPRLLRTFMQDTGNQVVLGTFVSTFLYCLLVLRTVHSGNDDAVFIPDLSVTIALVLAAAGLGVLIYFIHHVSVSLQVEHLAASIAEELSETVSRLFPERLGASPGSDAEAIPLPAGLHEGDHPIAAPRSGYLQTVENENLMGLAEEHDLVFCLRCAPGDFITEGATLMSAWPASRCDARLGRDAAGMFILGRHRTPTQDAKYSAQQLVSIAVRALSPGINDPFTAMTCIDWLGNALAHLAQRKIPSARRVGKDGTLRVIAMPTTFSELADVAFNPIRRYGANHAAVMLRMLETIEATARFISRQEDRDTLRRHAQWIEQQAHRGGHRQSDLAVIIEQYRRTLEQLDTGGVKAPPTPSGAAPSERA